MLDELIISIVHDDEASPIQATNDPQWKVPLRAPGITLVIRHYLCLAPACTLPLLQALTQDLIFDWEKYSPSNSQPSPGQWLTDQD